MLRAYPIILIFCVGCSLESSPEPGSASNPVKPLFHTDGSQGIAKLVGAAGGGGSVGHILVGHAGAGMVGTAGAAGHPSSTKVPDAGLEEPQQDAMVDVPDAGNAATNAGHDAAQTPPDAALPAPDASKDAGTLATPGKTCAPCNPQAPTCASHYECASYDTENVCLYKVTNAGGATSCPNHPSTWAPPLNPDHVGANTNPTCMPYDGSGYVPCSTWLPNNPNAGF